MAIEDVKILYAKIDQKDIETALLELGRAANPYRGLPLPQQATIDDFLLSFHGGSRPTHLQQMSVTARINKPQSAYGGPARYGGKIGIMVEFGKEAGVYSPSGTIRFSVEDNGENVSQEAFDEVYDVMAGAVRKLGLRIISEKLYPGIETISPRDLEILRQRGIVI